MSYQILGDGMDFIFRQTEKFKTTLLSVHFYTPVTEENTAVHAILPYLLIGGTPEFPDYAALNHQLDMLYGAELNCKIRLIGDIRQTSIQLTIINDTYAKSDLLQSATAFLQQVLFSRLNNGYGFKENEIVREKRLLCQQIESWKNNKRAYACQKATELLFAGEAAGIHRLGTTEAVNALTADEIFAAYRTLLQTARVRIIAVGDRLPSDFVTRLSAGFAAVGRNHLPLPEDCLTPCAEPQTVTERMPVTQGKLVLGFCGGMGGGNMETLPLYVMTDLLGGGPYSKLFLNVREKQSLCYYCAASAVRTKGALLIDSGIEPANADRVKDAVLTELNALATGDFTAEQLQTSQRALFDGLQSIKDDALALEGFLSLSFRKWEEPSLSAFAEGVTRVTAEQVQAAAAALRLKTVYILLPEEGVEQ
ncbi:MAG: insulinase family protein [Clostridia bacterium]|nr:insulinase family protein [Clostridia bacterium]